jgi:hypothetical protein
MLLKVTYFFRCKDQGWSESHYGDHVDYTTAGVNALALANARLGLLTSDAYIIARRISKPDTKRDSVVTLYPIGSDDELIGEAEGNVANLKCNQPSDAVIFEVRASPALKNRVYLRGIPDTYIVSGEFTPAAAWTTQAVGNAVGTYLSRLKEGGWYVKAKDAESEGGFSYSFITDGAVLGLTSRKTGRPFGLRRGRRSNRRVA